MLCEGEKMLGEALRSGAKLKTVLVKDGWDSPFIKEAEEQGATLYSAPDALFKLASEVETPQNVIFSCEQPQWTADALDGAGQVLLLDGLQDPGNLGTILRTAEAFALGAVVLCEGCRSVFTQGRALDDGRGVPSAVRDAPACGGRRTAAPERSAAVRHRAA